jgi:hypothetical protein
MEMGYVVFMKNLEERFGMKVNAGKGSTIYLEKYEATIELEREGDNYEISGIEYEPDDISWDDYYEQYRLEKNKVMIPLEE